MHKLNCKVSFYSWDEVRDERTWVWFCLYEEFIQWSDEVSAMGGGRTPSLSVITDRDLSAIMHGWNTRAQVHFNTLHMLLKTLITMFPW